jgi:hypothetical protein
MSTAEPDDEQIRRAMAGEPPRCAAPGCTLDADYYDLCGFHAGGIEP